jgi:hypothetical protein
VTGLPHPRITAKTAPGFEPPAHWHAEWTSVDRGLVECCASSWALAPALRRAVVIRDDQSTIVDAVPEAHLPIAEVLGAWLHEVDPAVTRAGAESALPDAGLCRVDPHSTWLTSDEQSASPALRSHRVVAELVGSRREQRQVLRDAGITRATVKSRDVDGDPRDVLRELDLREGPGAVIVLTHRAGRQISLLVDPADARSR